MPIPLVDLRAQHDELRGELEAAFTATLDDSGFVGGARVSRFETAWAGFCGAEHAVAVGSGTDALVFAYRAAGIGPGDLIVTSPMTFAATAEAACLLGATVRFVDIEPDTYNLDVARLAEWLEQCCERDRSGVMRERAGGWRVAAIVPVHLYGLPVDMAALVPLAAAFDLPVIEDACQAHGAAVHINGRWVGAGALGRAAAFSFYPSKNLGALGEAGAVTTNDATLAETVRLLRDHGQPERYVHVLADATNGRMDALQAALLTIKLSRLVDWNERRQRAARWYDEELAALGVPLPSTPEGRRHVFHQYVVRVPAAERARIRTALEQHGIQTGLHYPIPLHLQPSLAALELGAGAYPEAERAAAEVLSLPMHPHLSHDDVREVAAALKQAL